MNCRVWVLSTVTREDFGRSLKKKPLGLILLNCYWTQLAKQGPKELRAINRTARLSGQFWPPPISLTDQQSTGDLQSDKKSLQNRAVIFTLKKAVLLSRSIVKWTDPLHRAHWLTAASGNFVESRASKNRKNKCG